MNNTHFFLTYSHSGVTHAWLFLSVRARVHVCVYMCVHECVCVRVRARVHVRVCDVEISCRHHGALPRALRSISEAPRTFSRGDGISGTER